MSQEKQALDDLAVVEIDRLIEAAQAPVNPEAAEGTAQKKKKGKKRVPAGDLLLKIAMDKAKLFHDAGKIAYAMIHGKTIKVRSRAFRLWLTNEYFKEVREAANKDAMAATLNTIESHAVFNAVEQTVYVRIAENDNTIFLNLADEAGAVIEIDSKGWRVNNSSMIPFLSTQNELAIPMPKPGGSIDDIKQFINCGEDNPFALLTGWIAGCFRVNGPFPLLALTGVQGSAKSTTSRVLKLLLDPEKVRDRSAPRDGRDLAIWSSNSWILCVDNISNLPDWLSDAFCRLSTGGGFGTRTLYENDEETVFDAKRPIIINGITDYLTRPDLLERTIIQRHPQINETARKLESELWADFEKARPKLLGAILDRVSAGLKALPSVDKSRLPRMADAAAFAIGCETGSGETPRFLEAFKLCQSDSHEMALADSIVVPELLTLIVSAPGNPVKKWEGTPTELFEAITPEGNKTPKEWPKRASNLTNHLKRLEPSLLKIHGISIEHTRGDGSGRKRIVKITKTEPDKTSNHADPQAVTVPEKEIAAAFSDDPDDARTTPGIASSGELPLKTSFSDDPDDPDDDLPLFTEPKQCCPPTELNIYKWREGLSQSPSGNGGKTSSASSASSWIEKLA